MIITLTPDIEHRLVEQARKQGTTPEQLAIDSLREYLGPAVSHDMPAETPETLADFLREHIGVLHSSEHVPGGAHMSENSSKKFAAGLLKQHHQSKR